MRKALVIGSLVGAAVGLAGSLLVPTCSPYSFESLWDPTVCEPVRVEKEMRALTEEVNTWTSDLARQSRALEK
jgi:hypothetical protein